MYLQTAGEEDRKTRDNWKADADGVLIFVSRHSTSDVPTQRLVYSRPPSRHWSQCPRRTSSRTLRTSIRSSPIRTALTPLPPPCFLIRPCHRAILSAKLSAVWVNSLWLLQLMIGPTCTLLASDITPTMGSPVHVHQSRQNPHKQEGTDHSFINEDDDIPRLPNA